MRIRMIQFGFFSLLIVCISVSQCNCELPANSYGPPPKSDNKPSQMYGPPPGGTSKPGSSYGPPPSPDIKPPSPGGAPSPTSDGSGGESGNGEAKPEPFNFMYEVKDMASGNDFSHKQESDGKTVKGEYKVLLPDGRNQVVTYTADAMGYNAEVKYDGEARPGPGPGPGAAPAGGKGGSGGGAGPSGGGYPSGGPGKSAPGGSAGYPSGGPPPGAPSFEGYPPAGPPANKSPPPASAAAPPSNAYLPPPSFSAGY